jgi:hypothetical protein
VFSSVKRKLSVRVPGRSLRMQVRHTLLLGLSFNLCRLRHCRLFLRMSAVPDNSSSNDTIMFLVVPSSLTNRLAVALSCHPPTTSVPLTLGFPALFS